MTNVYGIKLKNSLRMLLFINKTICSQLLFLFPAYQKNYPTYKVRDLHAFAKPATFNYPSIYLNIRLRTNMRLLVFHELFIFRKTHIAYITHINLLFSVYFLMLSLARVNALSHS